MAIKTLEQINQEFLLECILAESIDNVPEQAEAAYETAAAGPDTIDEPPGFLFDPPGSADDAIELEIDTPEPVVVVPQPAIEAPQPVIEAFAPVVEAPQPASEAPETEAEAPGPEIDAPGPEAEALPPHAEIPEPVFDTPASVDEAPGPEIEAPETEAEAPPPHAEIPEPVFDTPASVDEAPAEEETRNRARKKSKVRLASDIVFYTVVAFILLATLVFHGKSNDSIQVLDYSAFTVLTGSMQREIPQGSLVITKKVDPNSIVIGDDITYVRSDNATVTHRVVDIVEDYLGSGERGFQTQGIENLEPDPDIVYAGNLVGVVKITVPELGFTLKYISENIGLVFVLLGGILVAAIAISKLFPGSAKTARGTEQKEEISSATASAA